MVGTLTLAAALGGCVVGPNFSRPEPPAAPRYDSETARSEGQAVHGGTEQQIDYGRDITGDWWTLFHSDALDTIVNDAVAGNHGLAAMKATLAQTEELALSVSGSRYPQVGLAGGAGRQKYGAEFLGGIFNLPPFTYFAVGPTVSYTLDYNGGVARSVEREYALVDSSRQQFNAAYLSVTGQVVMQAIAVGSAREQIAMLETLLAQDRDNLKLVQGAFEAGSVARIDVLSAQSQIDSDMTLLPPLRQELSRARHALSILLGRTPASASAPDIDLEKIPLPEAIPVGVPSELAHRRPDILQAEAQLHAATSAVGIAESNLYPKIQLTATLTQEAVTPGRLVNGSSTAWSLISGFTAPLFDGGSLRAQKRAAVDALHASAANYEQTVIEAFGQVADLLDALNHDAEQLDAEMQAQETAQSGLDLARASYAEGNAGILQVLDAQRVYQQSRLGYVKAVAQRYLDTAQLILALGGTNPSAGAGLAKPGPHAS
jgi:NodT family efflux transporter outer membrane factor (OMF) lipoprotein